MKEKKIRKAVKTASKENPLKFKDVKNQLKEKANQAASNKALAQPAHSDTDTNKLKTKPYLNPYPDKHAEKLKKLSHFEELDLLSPSKLGQFDVYVQKYALSWQAEALLLKPENFAFFHVYNKYHCLQERNQVQMIADNNPQVIHEFQKRWHYSLHVKMKGEALRNKQIKPAL